ncbi:hypothetical protein GOODEAATRI_021407, partial [Goodea atripinnis]
FTIYINAYPAPKVSWMKDGQALSESYYIFTKTSHIEENRDHESAELDDIREFSATISSFPDAHVTWLKDGVPLSDVTAEISTSLRQISETRCANDTSSWAPLPTNSTEITMEAHFDEESNLESQVMFGHLESTLAVRCLAKNEMGADTREIKLVSNGKNTSTLHPLGFDLS